MSVIKVEYSIVEETSKSIKKAANNLEDQKNQLNKVREYLSQISNNVSKGNLDNEIYSLIANSIINQDKLNSLNTRLLEFSEIVESEDKTQAKL